MTKQRFNSIFIKGARVHNLKNISLEIPHNKLVVITGVSGSGKSTLAFDTIYAEGQRRYVESLSAYARQFLGRIDKPDVDLISGIAPAIAIEQQVASKNPRSTVGTSTEVYDYMKLLFSRIGRTYSPVSGREVRCFQADDVVADMVANHRGKRALIAAPIVLQHDQSLIEKLTLLIKEGIERVWWNSELQFIEDVLRNIDKQSVDNDAAVVMARVVVRDDEEQIGTMTDAVAAAMNQSEGRCRIIVTDAEQATIYNYSSRFEADGITFAQPTEHLFSFNNPIGACPVCEGYGKVTGIDEDLVVPDRNKSIYDGAVACWKGETMRRWNDELINNAHRFDFPIHTPFYQLTEQQKSLLWSGNKYFHGLNDFFEYLHSEGYKIQFRVLLSRYTGKTTCSVCHGSRLKPEALYVKVGGRNIAELATMDIDSLLLFFEGLELSLSERKTAERLLTEIVNRLQCLSDVGLGYLTLDRLMSTLSGGESQRINLAKSLGSNLTGSLYILDEPSVGLHPRDTDRLVKVLCQLRDMGNTVIVVEHEEMIIRAADRIIDIGPEAGVNGGRVVFNGTFDELDKATESLTADYLLGRREIEVPKYTRGWSNSIVIKNARHNNLKNIDVRIPLGVMTCITGVSGSGKSSLVSDILYPAMKRLLSDSGIKPGSFGSIEGDLKLVKSVEMIDQRPIGTSQRSNPVTYIDAYNDIRKLFAELPYSVHNGLTQASFSFNRAGGRCEECQGEGVIKVSMQFMADVELKCEHCGGRRFKEDVLEAKYRDKSIFDVLEMSVDEAVAFFGEQGERPVNRNIVERLKSLQSVGLGYVKLGQTTSTLSGGEVQRVKLASFLMKEYSSSNTMFIFDEPTTGLHFNDISKLLGAFDALIRNGHTIVVVEHNMDVIKCADWVVDLGPEAGDKGGELVFEGKVEDLKHCQASHTGRYLALHSQNN